MKTSRAKGTRAVHLRLLATSDLHMHLTSFDYSADRADPGVGLTRTASLIAAARREAEASGATVLLFDNGDGLQGTPLGDLALRDGDAPHPLMRAFEYLRYDAIGLGNHDFNFGLETLDAILRDAPCPVVCTNLRRCKPGVLPVPVSHAILNRSARVGNDWQPLRIGVLSVLPPQTVMWDRRLLAGRIAIADIVASARETAGILKRAGCDVVVALAHSGLADDGAEAVQENAVIPLAACNGIDAIIAGHTHQVLPGVAHAGLRGVDAHAGTVHGKPVVMAGFAGSHLGQIDLTLAQTDGVWSVAGHQSRTRAIAERDGDGHARALAPEDDGLAALMADSHDRARADLARPVGKTGKALHSYFCFVAPDPAQHLIAEAQAAMIESHLPADLAGLPLLSATAPARFGGRSGPHSYTDIATGRLTRRYMADLVPFPNHIRAVVLTGGQVLDWLEMSASLFNRIEPDARDAELVDPRWPGHGFDTLFGLRYRIDLSQPALYTPQGTRLTQGGGRITGATWQGRPVEPAQRFVVALNNYRANGGGNVPGLRDARQPELPALTMHDAVLARVSAVPPAPSDRFDPAPWSFVPMPAARVLARTGPGGRGHLSDLRAHDPRELGIDCDGFLKLSLSL